MITERVSHQAFFGAAALLFAASAALTIGWSTSMSSMDMPMPGGWTMSMMWMPAASEGWLGTLGSFLGMWVVMMVAMMLPSLVPMLHRYRRAVRGAGFARPDRLTTLVGVGYFVVWAALGLIAFPLGVGLGSLAMKQEALARAVPVAAGAIVVLAGALQFTSWKARQLASCRAMPVCRCRVPANTAALRRGMCLGVHCSFCCAGPMAILLAVGAMDLRVMTLVTAAITVERLAPSGERVARIIGAIMIAAGIILCARALG
jgi:predicted metal-binding membrane protein